MGIGTPLDISASAQKQRGDRISLIARLKDQIRDRREDILIISAACIAILPIWIGIWRSADDLQQNAFQQARKDTGNLAILFEQNIVHLLDNIDGQLLVIKRQYESCKDCLILQKTVMDSFTIPNGVHHYAQYDANGNLVASTIDYKKSGINIADRPYFIRMRDSTIDMLDISEPLVSRVLDTDAILFSRRLSESDGSFSGIILVSMNPSYLTDIFHLMRIGPNGAITVLGKDGLLRSRASYSKQLSRDVRYLPENPALRTSAPEGLFVVSRKIDNIERLESFRRLARYPLIVGVGAAKSDFLTGARHEALKGVAFGGIATVVIMFISYVLMRLTRQRREVLMAAISNASRSSDFAKSASELQWETDPDDRFCWFSASAEHATMGDSTLMLGRSRSEFALDPNDPVWVKYRDDLAHRRPFAIVIERRRVDGTRWFIRSSGVPVYDASGRFVGYRGVTADVTAEMQAKRNSFLAETKLRAIAENLPGVVFQTVRAFDGSDFRFTYVSEHANAYFGQTPEALYRDPSLITEAIHPDEKLMVVAKSTQIPPLQEQWGYFFRTNYRDQLRWMQIIAQSVQLANGDIMSNKICIDITDVRAREEELKTAQEKMELAYRAKDTFLAHVSHELRTPLNAVIGFAEIIYTRTLGVDNPKYAEYAGHIHESGKLLLSIINDLLNISKIDSGSYEIYENQCFFEDILSIAMPVIIIQSDRKKIRVTLDVGIIGNILCDARHMSQILINILSNSVKFTPDGGFVQLSTELCDRRGLRIVIVDNGAGMSDDDIAHAFEPFRRGDAMVRQGVEGTGLGLPICARLIRLHGGTIEISSKLGEGTTVTITLPPERCTGLGSVAKFGAVRRDQLEQGGLSRVGL